VRKRLAPMQNSPVAPATSALKAAAVVIERTGSPVPSNPIHSRTERDNETVSGVRRPVMRTVKPALRSTLLQSAAVQRLASRNKVQTKPLSGSVQQQAAAGSAAGSLLRHSSLGIPADGNGHVSPPLRVVRDDSSSESAPASDVLGSPVSRRIVSLIGAPWSSPSQATLTSPKGVTLRMGSTDSGGMGSTNERRRRLNDMEFGAFALPGPAALGGAEGTGAATAPRSPPGPRAEAGASASAGPSEHTGSSPAAVVARGSRLSRVSSRGSLSLVAPGTPVSSAAASPLSNSSLSSPVMAPRVRRESSTSDSVRRASHESSVGSTPAATRTASNGAARDGEP
jgi:hypothetical protein